MSSILSDPRIRDSLVTISVEQYRRMGAAGIIDQQTELIEGAILQKMIKSPLHTLVVKELMAAIQEQLPLGWEVRKEEPLTLVDSEPEPDIAIVQSGSYDPLRSHPSTAHFVVEVAITSEALDRSKAAIYARAEVCEYWIVLPERRVLERFSDPSSEDKTFRHFESISMDRIVTLPSPIHIPIDLSSLPHPS